MDVSVVLDGIGIGVGTGIGTGIGTGTTAIPTRKFNGAVSVKGSIPNTSIGIIFSFSNLLPVAVVTSRSHLGHHQRQRVDTRPATPELLRKQHVGHPVHPRSQFRQIGVPLRDALLLRGRVFLLSHLGTSLGTGSGSGRVGSSKGRTDPRSIPNQSKSAVLAILPAAVEMGIAAVFRMEFQRRPRDDALGMVPHFARIAADGVLATEFHQTHGG